MPVLDGLIEVLGLRGLDRRLQAVDRLAGGRLGDVGQRLAGLELLSELVLGQPEVVRGARRCRRTRDRSPDRPGRPARRAPGGAPPRDMGPERRSAVGEALLGCVTLLLGQRAGGDGGVDPGFGSAFDGGVELVARDVQPLGEIVEERLLLGLHIDFVLAGGVRRGGRGVLDCAAA